MSRNKKEGEDLRVKNSLKEFSNTSMSTRDGWKKKFKGTFSFKRYV